MQFLPNMVWRRWACCWAVGLELLTVCGALASRAAQNPCSNGSFEQLAPNGFPADWAPLGRVEVGTNAHSGQRALRLLRASEPPNHETGLNRAALIRELKGGVEFAYQGIAASNALLRVYVIPVNADGIEKANAPRTVFSVPPDQIGDGQWHRTRLKYDYTANPQVKALHYAARIEGASGELWLDDFAYLERVGPLLRLSTPRLVEDPAGPGARCHVHLAVDNVGDATAANVQAQVQLPNGLRAKPAQVALGSLAPGARALPGWTVEGERLQAGILRVVVVCGNDTNDARLALVPALEVRSWGPRSPVVLCGEDAVMECEVVNTGQVIVLEPVAHFTCGGQTQTSRAARILPGQSATLRVVFPTRSETPRLSAIVRLTARNCAPFEASSASEIVVIAAPDVPRPSGRVLALSRPEVALLENEHLRLVFRRASFGWGAGELSVKGRAGWKRVAWLPGLARLRKGETDSPIFSPLPAEVQQGPDGGASLRFSFETLMGGARVHVRYETGSNEKTIRTCHEFIPLAEGYGGYFEGPALYVLDRDEALFPGVEWLVDNEVSSGTLDIAENHPDRLRHRVHPTWITIPAMGVHSANGTVGLLWDPHQKWDGQREWPGARFSSPDRVACQRAHRLGLFLPAVPEFVLPNTWHLQTGASYPLQPGQTLRIEAMIFADGDASDALAAMDEWVCRFGIPQPLPPPRGSYEKEVEFSMLGYLESLWVPAETNWWTSKGGGSMSAKGRPAEFIADLLVGELLSPDPLVRRRCRERAEQVLTLTGSQARLDAQRFPDGFAPLTDPARAAELLRQRDAQGAWRFNADQVGTGPFVGLNYHELGPDDAVELGTCARKAFEVLHYARITGDRTAYDQMQSTLELMRRFRVPRAAQVWEVPVHTPDILAAADAVDAFLEAYRFAGDGRWLEEAVRWARRGLPFVYLWQDTQRPYLLGASIPVFGATWMQGSWFGRPVQWNGLRYAEALLKLAPLDHSQPWHKIAVLLVHSALHQQDTGGENLALWPDNIGAVKSDKCEWVFAPRQILQNVLTLLGRGEDPATMLVGPKDRTLRLTSVARLEGTTWDGQMCQCQVLFPPGEQGLVALYNLSRPQAVLVDGQPAPGLEDVVHSAQAGWSYDEATAALLVRMTNQTRASLRLEGAAWRYVERLPQITEQLAFDFRGGREGWIPLHHIMGLTTRDGALVGEIIGHDPYLCRPLLRVRGADAPVVRLRLSVTTGQIGQFYWSTETAPGFSEERVLTFPLNADGRSHEYVLKVGQHPAWAAQIITAVRLDPGNGARAASFALDYIRGERP